jgi:hypothetical protein
MSDRMDCCLWKLSSATKYLAVTSRGWTLIEFVVAHSGVDLAFSIGART